MPLWSTYHYPFLSVNPFIVRYFLPLSFELVEIEAKIKLKHPASVFSLRVPSGLPISASLSFRSHLFSGGRNTNSTVNHQPLFHNHQETGIFQMLHISWCAESESGFSIVRVDLHVGSDY